MDVLIKHSLSTVLLPATTILRFEIEAAQGYD